MPQSGVYTIVNMVTEDFYIGSSVNIEERLRTHFKSLRSNTHYNSFLQRSFNKYGEKAFLTEIVEEVTDLTILRKREQYHMDTLHPTYNLIVMADDGKSMTVSEETRRKMSEAGKRSMQKLDPAIKKMHEDRWKRIASENFRKFNTAPKTEEFNERRNRQLEDARKIREEKGTSEETREKLSKAMTGKQRTEEEKAKISAKLSGRTLSEEHKQHIAEGGKGKILSEEHKQKISETRLKRPSLGMTGKKHSEETLKKMSEGKKASWDKKKAAQAENIEQQTLFD